MSEGSKKKKMSIEESFDYLDEALEKIEDEDLPLEEAFAVYEGAMKVLKDCGRQIDAVEKKVKVLEKNGSLSDLEDMED